jgi:drug/metabolite transporter (DMT)-like permease
LLAAIALRGQVNIHDALENATPLLIGGICGGSLAITAQTYAQRRLTAAQTGVILTLEPVVGSLVAFAWLAERPPATIWFGGAIIIAGIALANRRKP